MAVGSGGVWKTTNAGTTWTPIFDDQALVLDRRDSRPREPRGGLGRHRRERERPPRRLGRRRLQEPRRRPDLEQHGPSALASTSRRILVDPRDRTSSTWRPRDRSGPRAGSAASSSPPMAARPGRGAPIDENTGVTDLEFDPRTPTCSTPRPTSAGGTSGGSSAAGPAPGIQKTTDGGKTWGELTNGLADGDMGKIGLAVTPVDPDLVYATIEAPAEERGFYRSRDRGESWEKRNDYLSDGTGPHYYQEIDASPHRPIASTRWTSSLQRHRRRRQRLLETRRPDKHSDNHALGFVPANPDYLLVGTDGGLYESFDEGKTWHFSEPAGDPGLQGGAQRRESVLRRDRRDAGPRHPARAVAHAQPWTASATRTGTFRSAPTATPSPSTRTIPTSST